jgi:hypothetical protein
MDPNVEHDEPGETDDELLTFTDMYHRQYVLSIRAWANVEEYTGPRALKLVAFGSLGTQFELFIRPW